MIFKIFSSNLYPLNATNKRRSELISLITEPLALDNNEQFTSIPIGTNEEEMPVNEIDKSEANNVQVCRICYSTGDLRSLISPCDCSGTMGILHQNCLERWLEISNTTQCEICQHEFEVMRYPKSLFYFLTNPLRSSDIRYLINDIILFIFLTSVTSWLTIISATEIRKTKAFYDALCYLALPCLVFSIYIVWCWVSFRYHVGVIREWRSVNQLIRVIHKKEAKGNSDDRILAKSDLDQQYSLLYTLNSRVPTGENEENSLPEIRIVK